MQGWGTNAVGRTEKMGGGGIYFSDCNILYNPDQLNVSFKKRKENEPGRGKGLK